MAYEFKLCVQWTTADENGTHEFNVVHEQLIKRVLFSQLDRNKNGGTFSFFLVGWGRLSLVILFIIIGH